MDYRIPEVHCWLPRAIVKANEGVREKSHGKQESEACMYVKLSAAETAWHFSRKLGKCVGESTVNSIKVYIEVNSGRV